MSLRRSGVVVTGWIDADEVVKVPKAFWGADVLALKGSRSGCRADVPLFSLGPSGPQSIGRIKRGAMLTTHGHEAAFLVVEVAGLGATPDGARLAVRAEHASGCFADATL